VDFIASVGPTYVRPRLLNGWKYFIIETLHYLNDTCNFRLIVKKRMFSKLEYLELKLISKCYIILLTSS